MNTNKIYIFIAASSYLVLLLLLGFSLPLLLLLTILLAVLYALIKTPRFIIKIILAALFILFCGYLWNSEWLYDHLWTIEPIYLNVYRNWKISQHIEWMAKQKLNYTIYTIRLNKLLLRANNYVKVYKSLLKR